VLKVVIPPLCKGDNECRNPDAAARTPGSLDVIGGRRRDVPQQDCLDLTEINAKLERRRTAENVDSTSDELALNATPFGCGPLCGVLLHRHPEGFKRTVQIGVVPTDDIVEGDRRDRAVAAICGADPPHRTPRELAAPVASQREVRGAQYGELESFEGEPMKDAPLPVVCLNQCVVERRKLVGEPVP
jgi:hypothetical protein